MTECKRSVIVLGAGGHAKVVAEVLLKSGYEILGLVSTNESPGSICFGIKVLGDDDVLSMYSPKDVRLVNGIGALPGKTLRWRLAVQFREQGYKFTQVIHPSAIISRSTKLEEGVQVMAGAIIQPGVHVGQDSIINTRACIDHDCSIGNNCHLAPGVTLSGGVSIGEDSHLGTGSVVIQNVSIGARCVVAAGSVVHKNLAEEVTLIQVKQTRLNDSGELT